MDRLIPQLLLFSLGAGCSKPVIHIALDSAEGLVKGSRVYAAGVAVGEVDSVRVDGVQADVSFTLRPGNELSLRADACAMSLPDEGGALLILFPGKELERLSARPVPACEPGEQRLSSLKQLASSGGGALSQSIRRFLEGLTDEAPAEARPCGALSVSRLRMEQVSAVPVLLPSGGKRLWLTVENRGETAISLETATFMDARGTVSPQAHVPEEADLFMMVSIPAHTRREVSAIFPGTKANQVSAVEVKASFRDAASSGACSGRWPL